MSVTPMDLQVLFMQEPAAAKENDKRRRMENLRQIRLGDLERYRGNNPSVDETEESAGIGEVTQEGGGQGGFYSGGNQGEEESEESPAKRPEEEGKGEVMDFEA